MDPVRQFVTAVARRLGAAETIRLCARALCLALGLAAALVFAERLFGIGVSVPGAIAAPVGAALVAGLAVGVARWPSVVAAALAADRRLGLDERLSSALAAGDGPMAGLLRGDAERHVAELDPAEGFPTRIPPSGRAVPLLAALAAIALLVPDLDVLGRGQARANRAAMRTAQLDAQATVRALKRRAESDAQAHTQQALDEVLRALENAETGPDLRRAIEEARAAAKPTPDAAAADRELLRQAREALERLRARLGSSGHPSPKPESARGASAGSPFVRPHKPPEPKPSTLVTSLIEARAEADRAVARDNVPWRYRAVVKRYFTPETRSPRPGK